MNAATEDGNGATVVASASVSCLIDSFGDTTDTDLIPVQIQSITILEMDQNFLPIAQESIGDGTIYLDGDKFQYTSIAAVPDDIIVDSQYVPSAIQLTIFGMNQFHNPITNVVLINFTNDCGTFPVLVEGQSAGWAVFVSSTSCCFLRSKSWRLVCLFVCFCFPST